MKSTHTIDSDAADAAGYMQRLGQAARATADKNAALEAVARRLLHDVGVLFAKNARQLVWT